MAHLLVTGGARGIGAEVCRRAAARGWSVTINYRSDAAAAEAVAEAVRCAGGRAFVAAGDVASEADTTSLFDRATEALGPLSAVVANAGIVAPSMPLARMDLARLRRILDTNLLGTLLTAREAARRMGRSTGGAGGALVLLSSVAARLGAPGEYVDYAATKGAIDTLTLGLARELGPEGIRVNAVRPGVIATEIHAAGGQPGRAERIGATAPLARAGEPGEVAEAILWLLGDTASYVSGAILDVSGGR